MCLCVCVRNGHGRSFGSDDAEVGVQAQLLTEVAVFALLYGTLVNAWVQQGQTMAAVRSDMHPLLDRACTSAHLKIDVCDHAAASCTRITPGQTLGGT